MQLKNLFYLFVLISTSAFSQNGKIAGKVIDLKTGETLPGATVLIENTTQGASADFDGNFSIAAVKPGSYTIICKFISYADKKLSGIVVKEGEITHVNIALEEPKSDTLQEVVVVSVMNRENTNTLLIMQKNNASVSDGVSAEAIRRTPDRTTSDVFKRVTGASIQDNRFAIIRGLADRYNAAFINGTPLPSSESDRKAFAFDIFPANMLENLIIVKTATPDLPGDFAGGVIQINTKSIPEQNQQFISMSGSWNTLTTNQNINRSATSNLSWLGIDDGSRALPNNLPTTDEYKAITDNDLKADYAKSMIFNWGAQKAVAKPAFNLQYSIGQNFKIAKKQAGIFFALNYQSTPQLNYQKRYEWDEYDTGSVRTLWFHDEIFNQNTLASSLLNLSFKLNDNHQISSKNLISSNANDQFIRRIGNRNDNDPQPIPEIAYVSFLTTNIFKTTQLTGDHFFPKIKLKAKWVGGYSDVKRDVPGMLQSVYNYDYNVNTYAAVISDQENLQEGGNMFWSNTKENIKSVKYDFSRSFEIFDFLNADVKAGGYHQWRNRDFDVRAFKFGRYRKGSSIKFDNDLLLLPYEEIFNGDYMGLLADSTSPYNGGFKLNEITRVSDSYTASSVLHAGYLMSDFRIFEKHRLIIGARIENYQQVFAYIESGSNLDKKQDTTVLDILPSINYVFNVSPKLNIRAAYYRTVSRPEFRELAPFAFYNFVQLNIWSGDPRLKRALIDNYDLRFEWFPGGGQILSVTGFYKYFNSPVEAVQRTGVSGDPELFYTNANKVTNIGGELEYRLNLGFLSKDSDYIFDNLTVYSNLSIIRSRVDTTGILGAEIRPLQGQSPYIINAGINYVLPHLGINFSASYNVVGPRIFVVGNIQEPNVWERERHVLDFQLSKTFLKKQNLELRFNIRDILANDQIFYQDLNKNGKYDKKEKSPDNITRRISFGPTFSFAVSFKF